MCLVLDQSSGKQYIGSAYDTEGIWGRWKDYVASRGHGESVKLLAAEAQHGRHFQFTVLMTMPKTMTQREVVKREHLYMKKLGSRAYGLN